LRVDRKARMRARFNIPFSHVGLLPAVHRNAHRFGTIFDRLRTRLALSYCMSVLRPKSLFKVRIGMNLYINTYAFVFL
jgi:hypothetical protein